MAGDLPVPPVVELRDQADPRQVADQRRGDDAATVDDEPSVRPRHRVGHLDHLAGGTGGHVFPALACAREFQARGYTVHWLGTPRGIENELELPLLATVGFAEVLIVMLVMVWLAARYHRRHRGSDAPRPR